MSAQATVLLTAVFAALACSLVGTFLILRRMAMMADAISHAILPGIVLAYFVANGPNLIAGVAGATLAGLTTVVLVEFLERTGLVKSDAAIGIVFPALFALGTFFVSRFFSHVHLDVDAVLFGEIAFAPFDRLIVGGRDLGSQPLIVLAVLTVMNLLLVTLFYKEFKLATFDPGLAAALGFSPIVIHYALMAAVSMTTVGAFAAVGAILVVALLIVPAATAYLLTDRLDLMILLSAACGAASAVLGFYSAVAFDVSISGMMAVSAGILFTLAALLSPSHGLVARTLQRRGLREQFAIELLTLHLHHHETASERSTALAGELNWDSSWLNRVTQRGVERGWLWTDETDVGLTPQGREAARQHSMSIDQMSKIAPPAPAHPTITPA
ncbi:MAG TPA: metal ABC transporter permease [Thermomicrobiales bacterium]|nr:metal ABC transporter permease [Thermomicrobiales bacterium]